MLPKIYKQALKLVELRKENNINNFHLLINKNQKNKDEKMISEIEEEIKYVDNKILKIEKELAPYIVE